MSEGFLTLFAKWRSDGNVRVFQMESCERNPEEGIPREYSKWNFIYFIDRR